MSFVSRHAWALGLGVGFAVMVAVNIGFLVVAVQNADPVVPSYESEDR